METVETSVHSFFTLAGPASDAGDYSHLLQEIPADVPELVKLTQSLMVHIFWAERYGLSLTEARKEEVQLRTMRAKLAVIQELQPGSLLAPRPLERKLVGNCRDFSLMLASLLKFKGVPARARCGFGTYFLPDHFEDHWVTEYWNAAEGRWVMVDSQLDALQQEVLKLDFDPMDMPPGKFVLAGEAWQMCRAGQADPEKFGIFQWHGMAFIRGNLFRDTASLNRFEILPWDFWGMLEKPIEECTPAELALFDRAAELTLHVDECFGELRELYQENQMFQPPAEWFE